MSSLFTLRNLLAPAISFLLLVGMWGEGRLHQVSDERVGAFHTGVQVAADRIPYQFEVRHGTSSLVHGVDRWDGEDRDSEMPDSSVKLLKPNVIRCRRFENRSTREYVTLIIVQCRDARDMGGHYPPNCYPAFGWEPRGEERTEFEIDGRMVPVAMYEYTWESIDEYAEKIVYNFFVRPNGAIEGGLGGVLKAASDRRARLFGAAQIQATFDPSMNRARRDEVFEALLSGLLFVDAPHSFIDALGSGDRE